MAVNLTVAYIVLGIYLLLVLGCGVIGAFMNWRNLSTTRKGSLIREHFMAGTGLGTIVWFFSMAASLFSGYSVTGIVNEAFNNGWTASRWIPGGVGVYIGFMVMAPRCHALGKSRGYMTVSELIFDRYLPPAGRTWVAHVLRLLSFAFLQLPVFTYLISQFRSVGLEVKAFTDGGITDVTAVLTAAGVLLICDLMGGMRAVAFSDVLQGAVLFLGSIIFLIIQRTELGGLPRAFDFWSNPENLTSAGNVAGMLLLPKKVQVVSYFDFVFKTAVAATMYPHLAQRLFVAKDSAVIRKGLGVMNLTFFIVQLSSMITGWVAVSALYGVVKPGSSAFAGMLRLVAAEGTGQSLASALLLASGICAMMSTADSALLAFSTMWVRDLFKPYLYRKASEPIQLVFGKLMAIIGLVIGVALTILNLRKGKPDLSSLFSLQSVTPIHVVPAVWLGLHWRSLRGEAVLAGMISGAAVTFGLTFSDKNVKLKIGDDMLENGLSGAWVGFCVNLFVTVVLGLAYQFGPRLLNLASAANKGLLTTIHPRRLDIGGAKDLLISPLIQIPIVLFLLFSVPFYWKQFPNQNTFVGDFSAWAFTSLLIAGVMAIITCFAYVLMWRDYTPLPVDDLPSSVSGDLDSDPTKEAKMTAEPIAS